MYTFVIGIDGTKLMPTSNIKKIRKLLRSGRAKIVRHDPFTVQLLYETGCSTQPVELTEDTGYEYIGISVKSAKHEYVSEELTCLTNEKVRHDSCRKHRRKRRNRKRHRPARFNNRKATKPKGWIAPSLEHKVDIHVREAQKYIDVCPITSVTLEMGQFDTQVLKAVDNGEPIPEGVDYQHGPAYGYDTLREAVFARDEYKCQCCGKSAFSKKEPVILRMHHIGYWKGDRSNRMSNLMTVCTNCHTPANHTEGSKLYGKEPRTKSFKSEAFMNTVKWILYARIRDIFPDEVNITYGAATKRERLGRHLKKSCANDAYCIGRFHPGHRAHTIRRKKVRRHNRILDKFYDSKWIDSRDGTIKKGAALPNGRTNRNHKRDTENLRIYRRQCVEKGRIAHRTIRSDIQRGDVFLYKGLRYVSDGTQSNGKAVKLFRNGKTVSPSINSVKRLYRGNGWQEVF